ncbi:MAG: 2-hydroxychromene-2-carboxylate isomerase [Rhodocyclaceae bacterium]
MSEAIEFWFDFSSPYSYLASEGIDALAQRYGRKVKWRPMLLGVAFGKTGQQPLLTIPLKGEYSRRDIERCARYYGVPFAMPEKFPLATQGAARAYYWLHERDCALARAFAHAVFRAYWVEGRDISQTEVVLGIAAALGVGRQELEAALASPALRQRLREHTDGIIARGMFGAPWFVVDGEPFWGADRLPQIEKWLATGGF